MAVRSAAARARASWLVSNEVEGERDCMANKPKSPSPVIEGDKVPCGAGMANVCAAPLLEWCDRKLALGQEWQQRRVNFGRLQEELLGRTDQFCLLDLFIKSTVHSAGMRGRTGFCMFECRESGYQSRVSKQRGWRGVQA